MNETIYLSLCSTHDVRLFPANGKIIIDVEDMDGWRIDLHTTVQDIELLNRQLKEEMKQIQESEQ